MGHPVGTLWNQSFNGKKQVWQQQQVSKHKACVFPLVFLAGFEPGTSWYQGDRVTLRLAGSFNIGIGTFWNQSFNGKNQVWQQRRT